MSSLSAADEVAFGASRGLQVHERFETNSRDDTSPVRSTSSSEAKHYSMLRNDAKCIPWTLHRAHLTGLLIFLLSLIITLQIVYRHSENNQGLATATENIHYFWTYGPTAGMWLLL
jgi:hypothetical protein